MLSDDGFSVLLVQQWAHDFDAWTALGVPTQERAMGRTKADSIELDHKPADSHVARTVVVEDGAELDIFNYTTPLTGADYVIPSTEALAGADIT